MYVCMYVCMCANLLCILSILLDRFQSREVILLNLLEGLLELASV